MQEYKQFDTNSIIEYLSSTKEIAEFFGSDKIEASEIGDGNLNFVYLIKSKQNPKKALIAKQAVPYLRCVGEDFALGRERMTFEIRALKQNYKVANDFVPKIYFSSEQMSLVVMKYLGNHTILRAGLIDMVIYPNFSKHISSYLANSLFFTSSLYLQSKNKRELIDKFNSNTELCKLTEDFVFTFAFMENETNDNDKDNPLAKELFSDMTFKQKVLELKYKFMTQNDALLHGDLHTGSIMINKDETFVIDPEFAFVGPFGFDIGALIANLVSAYIHHSIVKKEGHQQEYKQWLLRTIQEVLEKFEEKFFKLWCDTKDSALLIDGFISDLRRLEYQKNFTKNILQDSIGFAGCKMARRIFGVAGVEEIRGIKDKALRHQAQKMVLTIARKFVLEYDLIASADEVISIISNADK